MEDKNQGTDLTKYVEAVKAITKEQSKIVGESVAFELAKGIDGLKIDGQSNIEITGNPVEVLKNLVERYSILFGKISIEVSKDAVEHLHLFEAKDLPANLQ
jgi:hypothetical protein